MNLTNTIDLALPPSSRNFPSLFLMTLKYNSRRFEKFSNCCKNLGGIGFREQSVRIWRKGFEILGQASGTTGYDSMLLLHMYSDILDKVIFHTD